MLQLVLDTDNRYDPNAVAVVYTAPEDDEPYCIGYIPMACNATVAAFLEMGWTDAFECRISKIDPDAYHERQIHLTIKIKRNQI